MPKRIGFALSVAGLWYWALTTASALCERATGQPALHDSPFSLTVAVLDARAVWAFGPMAGGIVTSFFAAYVLSPMQEKATRPPRAGPGSKTQWGAILLPTAGGVLWFLSSIAYALHNHALLLDVFFLPIMWAMRIEMPDAWYYVLVTVGVPAQYFVVGVAVDVLRRAAGSGRALRVASGPLCLLALLICFPLLVSGPPAPDSRGRGYLGMILAVYAAAITIVLWLGLRQWHRGRAALAATAGHKDEPPSDGDMSSAETK